MQHLKEILFIDIETVPVSASFGQLPEVMQAEWVKKTKSVKINPDANADPDALFDDRAGIFAEFAKVVCIGFGSLQQHETGWKMRLKSLVNHDEKALLKDFCDMLAKFTQYNRNMQFCGHNIKEFDIPFLCRRMVINDIQLPACMQIAGKKPWEVNHIDTMDLWRFGDHKNFTSLSLLAAVLGIPSPKSDMDGSMVGTAYWRDQQLARIGAYCLQDVLTSARVYVRLRGLTLGEIEPVFVDNTESTA